MLNTLFIQEMCDDTLKALGISAWGYISTDQIVFSEEIRAICANGSCRNYGRTWACPPAVGTYEACRQMCLNYDSAFVFSAAYPLEDSFDIEGMQYGHREFKALCDRLHPLLRTPCLLLSNEGCIRCTSCTYPDAPCRFPQKLFPSLEGFGIYVNKLAESAGIPYRSDPLHVHYFGLVCFNK